MRSFFHLTGASILATIALVGSVAAAAGASIEAAKASPEGTTVTVEGVVSVPSGSYDPNDLGFAIQAGNDGIYIHDSLGGDYQLGQTVVVTGEVGNSFGQVYGVYPDAIQVTGSHPVHPAKKVKTGDLGEEHESRLIRVRGTVLDEVFDDAPYGWIFHVDDGSGDLTVFVYTGTGIDTSEIEPGDELEITGMGGQFIDHYELNPRFQSDIVEK
ncbi:MAG: hypothetical protein IPK82_26090 [Polyangiaceae bacterium]|nr:hypothetical protein [Polyangiaceae bacterium]